jgi:hypothetical protein
MKMKVSLLLLFQRKRNFLSKECVKAFKYTFRSLSVNGIDQRLRSSQIQDLGKEESKELFAVLRVDTHGNRFIVQQHISFSDAKTLEKHYDSMPHHQGYYVVRQSQIAEELKRIF